MGTTTFGGMVLQYLCMCLLLLRICPPLVSGLLLNDHAPGHDGEVDRCMGGHSSRHYGICAPAI